jgi:two-component system chemotaxis response regulator CheB
VVTIAGSAGGVAALAQVLRRVPAEFPVPIAVVQHVRPDRPNLLARVLGRETALEVREAEEGDQLRSGVVYLAPPDRHLLVSPAGRVVLSGGERVRFVRPAADRLFEAAALSFGPRALAVVLTGAGGDGTEGVRTLKKLGGTVLAQDAGSAAVAQMPRSAIRTGCVDFVLPLGAIASALITLAAVPGAAEWFGVPPLPEDPAHLA